ncbi:CDGSH iron-sulfur domain-containing protein 3, mitochondrial [Phaenicophaeus curvirostris]|uniref:CDGSH iron-sulfur domain-containing protein 3, mitochondrial n=1 Tax=Phaenicophaeus curvirostris TaxID=33595 RepID=UPI0037F0F1FC
MGLRTLMRKVALAGPGRGSAGVWHTVSFSSAPPKPVIAAKEPFPVELRAGKLYAWCACGHSKRQPFCDGAHKKAAPGISPLRFTPEEDKTAWLCGCKHTRSPPYCDGSHLGDMVQSTQLSAEP